MSSVNSRSYVQTSIANFVAPSQKFTSCHKLLSQTGSEFHITDTNLIEYCNKMEVMMKEVNNIDAPERARVFEDFSTTPFNSPSTSPERNLEGSPLFTLREKLKRYSSRKNLNSKKSSDSILETSDLDYNDIEEMDTHNINEASVPSNQCETETEDLETYLKDIKARISNMEKKTLQTSPTSRKEDGGSLSSDQCKTGISENYNWDEDDNDLFLSISTQEILDQNNFPSTSKREHKFPVNKEITQGNQRNNKNLMLSESNVELGFQKARLGEGKNELEEVANKMHQDEVGKINNPITSLVSAGFETANGKKISISEEGHKSIQNILREF
uniref:Uncharacterized protein n=1 Tax=Glossina pallidipes TaxID=7398 RepID=A0A1A9ZIZ5_GLOPL